MKQKVVTRAIIKQDGRLLLLRRHGGRPSISGLYELPGGRVHSGQQPEEALAHALHIHVHVTPETMSLIDVMTFIDPDDREVQYLFVVYEVSLKPVDKTIQLSGEFDKYIWKKLSDIQRNTLTQSTMQILGLTPAPFATEVKSDVYRKHDENITTGTTAIVYSDGGSRGNPGESAAGFVIMNQLGDVIAEGGAFLGIATNNIAEYRAVYLGLEKAQELGFRRVDFRMDSQLVVGQLNGMHKVTHPDLLPIYHRITELASQFDHVSFSHVLREYNQLADGVVNKILDEHQATGFDIL